MANRRVGVNEKGRDRPTGPAAREVRSGQPLDLLRIDCIRAALVEGEYVVNPRRVAEKLLKFERGLPRS